MTVEPDPLLGRIIAERYEIVSLISAGGMGVVYRAKQRSLDRPVAIKFIHPQFSQSDVSVRRFLEEARAVSRLNHPHVVSVFDFGRTPEAEGGSLFLVMELLTGPDLARVLVHERSLTLPRVASITLQTLEALAEAHHLGIVHRDVKPENILLEPMRSGQDHVKVIDFGIARNEASGGDAAPVGGTPNYMAPEQRAGAGGPSADIFSTGVVLFEMLTGRLPSQEAMAAGDLAALDPRKAAPRRGIPEELAAACVRALAADPARRFPDAQAFANAIRAAIASSVAAEPSGFWERAGRAPAPRHASSPTLPAFSTRDTDGQGGSAGATASAPGNAKKLGTAPLLGRDDDIQWACDLLRAEPPPPAVAFWGRPGIGRTRLVREVAAVAESEGHLVVTVGLPPQPSDEVGYIGLRHIVRALSGITPAELMDDRAVSPVDRWALMGLRMLFSKAKPPSEPQVGRRTAEAALAWAMARAQARSPEGHVVLVLDDLDRLDGASSLALRDRLQGDPMPGVTVLVASQHARTVVLLPRVRERMLRGISGEDACRMLAALASEPPALSRPDDDVTPLYVVQVAATDPAGARDLAETLDEVVSRRMSALTIGQRRILQALAVVGVQHVESLGVLLRHPGDLDAMLESLIDSGWVERRGAHLLLRHRIYGAAALAGAPSGAVAALHKAAAHQLRDARQLSELRAYHAIQGAADFEAFVMLEDVARLRSARGDDEGAIAALSRAVAAARVQVLLGETEAASAALGVFGRKLATSLVAAGRIDEAQGVLDEVLRVAEPRALTRAAVLEQLATIAAMRGHAEEASQRRREALEIAERTDDQKLKDRLRDAVEGTVSPPSPPSLAAEGAAAPQILGARPVLIVEDDRSIREGLEEVIESEGYQAFGAGNGREALDLLRRIPRPGLILLDLMMPVMNGWDVLEALRADEEFATIPVVVVSAVSERSKLAASRVLRKPVEIGKLLGIVEELCA